MNPNPSDMTPNTALVFIVVAFLICAAPGVPDFIKNVCDLGAELKRFFTEPFEEEEYTPTYAKPTR